MDLNRCYEWYDDYFRTSFPLAAQLIFEEWVGNISATSPAGISSTAQEKKLFAGNKQKSTKIKEETNVNVRKNLIQEIEKFNQPGAWSRMKQVTDKKGL